MKIRAVTLTRTLSKVTRCVEAVTHQEGVEVDHIIGLTSGWMFGEGVEGVERILDAKGLRTGATILGRSLVAFDKDEFNFSRMNNHLARVLPDRDYSHLLFLNDDAYLEQPDALRKMLDAYEKQSPFPAAVGLKLVYPPGHWCEGRIQHAGVHVGPARCGVHRGRHARYDSYDFTVPSTVDVWAVTGAAMLVSRRDFGKVGGFDEGYQDVVQDIDLCMKLAALRETYTYHVTPKCRVVQSTYGYHEEGATRRVWGDIVGPFAFMDAMTIDQERFRDKWLKRTVGP